MATTYWIKLISQTPHINTIHGSRRALAWSVQGISRGVVDVKNYQGQGHTVSIGDMNVDIRQQPYLDRWRVKEREGCSCEQEAARCTCPWSPSWCSLWHHSGACPAGSWTTGCTFLCQHHRDNGNRWRQSPRQKEDQRQNVSNFPTIICWSIMICSHIHELLAVECGRLPTCIWI